ncbi:MAG: VOC family protein [Acidobacteria bacterium]|nr:VOC family protein [Acidobacteriota bacterium]
MTVQNSRMVFINLPVRDLERTKAFFTALGFAYNPQFTDANAACMVLNDQAFVMLLAEPFFKGFTKRQICDTSTHTEVLVAVSCTSRDDVDEMVRKAIAAGGAPAMPPVDHGFMYGSSFYDVDGHHWEVTWMDPKAIE